MAHNYQPGFALPVVFTLAGSTAVTLNVKGWDLDDGGNLIPITNTATEGRTGQLAGVALMKGQCTLSFDLDAKPYSTPPNIKFGTRGVFRKYTDRALAAYIQVPASIQRVVYRSGVEHELQWVVEWMENVFQPSGVTAVTYV